MNTQQFHERYSKYSMYTEYAGHRIYYVAKNGRAIIVRNGQIVDWVKAGSMPRTLLNARLIVDEHNEMLWDTKIAKEEMDWEDHQAYLAAEEQDRIAAQNETPIYGPAIKPCPFTY